MNEQRIHQYIRQFFGENECNIVDGNHDYVMVQLTADMDRRIMNRPFYWSYVDSMGIEPQPAKLTLLTNPKLFSSPIQGERIHFGSPRLHQLFEVTKAQGAYVQLYESPELNTKEQRTLTPWLAVNYKITYSSNRTKEALYSLGMNLINGAVIDSFQPSVSRLQLSATIPANTYYLPYIIHPSNAIDRLDALMERVIQDDDHTWIEKAEQKRVRDQRVLDYFYAGVEDLPDSYTVEKQAIDEQYAPSISIDVINGGLFYVHSKLMES